MLSWVLQSWETVLSRTEDAPSGLDLGHCWWSTLTGPELFFVLDVIRNLVFHAMNSFMSRTFNATSRPEERAEQRRDALLRTASGGDAGT